MFHCALSCDNIMLKSLRMSATNKQLSCFLYQSPFKMKYEQIRGVLKGKEDRFQLEESFVVVSAIKLTECVSLSLTVAVNISCMSHDNVKNAQPGRQGKVFWKLQTQKGEFLNLKTRISESKLALISAWNRNLITARVKDIPGLEEPSTAGQKRSLQKFM